MENLRGTGRTHRMIQEAIRLAREGRAVYVIAADQSHRKLLESQIPDGLGISVETPGTTGNFDWQRMELRGAHENCVVLADHYAIESNWPRMLEMLHRFDPPAAPVPFEPQAMPGCRVVAPGVDRHEVPPGQQRCLCQMLRIGEQTTRTILDVRSVEP